MRPFERVEEGGEAEHEVSEAVDAIGIDDDASFQEKRREDHE
jgi:hypothetical protein